MRIMQAYISKSVESFKDRFLSKYDLVPYFDKNQPLVIFGLYVNDDFMVYKNHKSKVVVVWCGSDGLFMNRQKADIVNSRPAKHYVMGGFISHDLKKFAIKHEVKMIAPSKVNLDYEPRGHKIYSYGTNEPDFYNIKLAQKVADKLNLEYEFTQYNSYSFRNLVYIYKTCFINLRLTLHDGGACSVLEMGLMGRRSVYNGGSPHCYKWQSFNDICDAVHIEYKNRSKDNHFVSEAYKNYINNDDKWLWV